MFLGCQAAKDARRGVFCPRPVFPIFFLSNRTYGQKFPSHGASCLLLAGIRLLETAVVLDVIAFFTMRRIVKVDY